jgi:FKBP-type peptidyl-prolyl cis-trans isomerase 2
MAIARPGSTVTISYIGTLDNGRLFDSSDASGPLTFTIGAGEVFPALEKAVLGLRPGEVKNVVLSTDQAYGPRRPENVVRLARSAFPDGEKIAVGQKLSIEFADGDARVMRVAVVDETEVTLDGNHPLAGCELTFALKVERVE